MHVYEGFSAEMFYSPVRLDCYSYLDVHDLHRYRSD